MLIKLHAALEAGQEIKIEKHVQGREVSRLGAFARGTVIDFSVKVPRALGIAAVVMRLAPDGEDYTDLPLTFLSQTGGKDHYGIALDTSEICEKKDGLFFYEFLLLRGLDTLFTDSINNVDFHLCEQNAERFRLLVYDADYRTPDWFKGGVMYHVFPDRFCRGEGDVVLKEGSVLDEDWENGVPQYALKAGAPLSNNVFFGGNLWGVTQKLDFLQSLGVTVLYLSPIFESVSNHRYDTADYEKIDSLLGGEKAFDTLIREAHQRGIRVILDGVFNHTGDDSKYFGRRGNYNTVGAYQSKSSPYAKWFSFRAFPDDYEAWWGIEIMPRLQQSEPACRSYFTGKGGIVERWLERGADGWRLDVADELPDVFLDELRTAAKGKNPDALIIGEVWENAVDKIAYGTRRRYFRGGQLDSVMNYPFRNAVLALLTECDAESFYNILTELWGTYPEHVSHSLMNIIGTHDTERILTLLGDGGEGEGLENPALAKKKLEVAQKRLAIRRLKLASILQYTVFGVPSVYYGDEAGLEGYHDPFCRRPYPWGRENQTLLEHYRRLGELRRRYPVLGQGDFRFWEHTGGRVAFCRSGEGMCEVAVLANAEATDWEYTLKGAWKNALTGARVPSLVTVPRESALVLVRA